MCVRSLISKMFNVSIIVFLAGAAFTIGAAIFLDFK